MHTVGVCMLMFLFVCVRMCVHCMCAGLSASTHCSVLYSLKILTLQKEARENTTYYDTMHVSSLARQPLFPYCAIPQERLARETSM